MSQTPFCLSRKPTPPPPKRVDRIPETRCSIELKEALDAYCAQNHLYLSQVVIRAIYFFLHVESFDLAKYNQDWGLKVSEGDDKK